MPTLTLLYNNNTETLPDPDPTMLPNNDAVQTQIIRKLRQKSNPNQYTEIQNSNTYTSNPVMPCIMDTLPPRDNYEQE
jgi:hypothetical protein